MTHGQQNIKLKILRQLGSGEVNATAANNS
jgi:hypothetical protein